MSDISIEKTENIDNWSEHWSMFNRLSSENPSVSMRHWLILRYIKELDNLPKSLLDVGSGQGDFLTLATEHNAAKTLVGFELSEVGVEISRRRLPDAKFYQVNLFSPPSEVESYESLFDVAVCSEVIEHVDDPGAFLHHLKKYLKPDGTLILTVPGGPMSAFDQYIGHRTHYTRKTTASVLEAAGFKVHKINMAGFPFFNLYRLIVVLRGRKVISDGEKVGSESGNGFLLNVAMRIFRFLYRFNINKTAFGWQIIAIAKREH